MKRIIVVLLISMAASVSVSRPVAGHPRPGGSPAQAGDAFQMLCSQPGVIKCVDFETPIPLSFGGFDNSGILSGDMTTPSLDSTVAASGNSSLKFTIPPNADEGSAGSYFTNFSTDLSTQFGANSEFFVQWAQRFSPEFLAYSDADGNGWKQADIGTGDQLNGRQFFSCTDTEVVPQNTFYLGFAMMYNSCTGSSSHQAFNNLFEPFGTFDGGFQDYKLQNGRPSPYCLRSQAFSNPPASFFPPLGNCLGYFANEWMTFEVHIKTGPRGSAGVPGASPNDEFVNSYVQLWIAREGQPGQLAISFGPYNLSAGDPADDQKYGKVWLLPYDTGKDMINPVEMDTWYDNLIISAQPISINGSTLPGLTPADNIPPVTKITESPLPNANGWNNSNVELDYHATDNTGGSGVKQISINSVITPGDSASLTVSAEGTTNVSEFATDNAGNVESANNLTVKLDRTPPTATASASPGPNTNGWNNSSVAVSFSGKDGLSGIDFCTGTTTLLAEGYGQTVSGTCTDKAGNVSAAATDTVNIDEKPPAISGMPAAGCSLWPPNKKMVTVATVTAADALSGLAPGSFKVTGTSSEPQSNPGSPDVVITPNGGGFIIQLRADRLGSGSGRVYSLTASANDLAGNTTTVTANCTVPHDQGK